MSNPYPLTEPRRGRGCIAAALALLLGLAAIAAALWWTTYQLNNTTQRVAAEIAAKFQRAFNFTPEIRTHSTTIVAATAPVLELVTVQKQALVRHDWSQTWLHSTKTLEIEATFTVRAGFDLTAPFVVIIDPATGAWSVTLPPAKLLNVSMNNIRIQKDEDGLWNVITAEDRNQAMQALENKAKAEFAATRLLAEAQSEAERRIRDLAGARPVEFITPPVAP